MLLIPLVLLSYLISIQTLDFKISGYGFVRVGDSWNGGVLVGATDTKSWSGGVLIGATDTQSWSGGVTVG